MRSTGVSDRRKSRRGAKRWHPNSASRNQIHLYGYDAHGFLLSERHPETGPNGNSTMNYVRDAVGQARRQTYGSRALSYLDDDGGRLTKIKNTGMGGQMWKEWNWASGNAGTNYGREESPRPSATTTR